MATTPPTPLPSNFFRGLRNIFNGALASILNTTRDAADDKLPLAGGEMTGDLTVTDAPARINLKNPSNSVDKRHWRWEVGGDVSSLYHVDDGGSAMQLQTWTDLTVTFPEGATMGGTINCSFNLITNCTSLFVKASGGAPSVEITSGTGVPAISAGNGSLFLRTDGGAGEALYVRENGAWVVK